MLNLLIASSLLVLLFILFSTNGQDVGKKCEINNVTNSGICKRLQDCSIIYQELLAGKSSSKICGYNIQYEPVVCCPTSRFTTTSPSMTELELETTTETNMIQLLPLTLLNKTRGTVAREKCAENAKAVYVLKPPLIDGIDRTPVNVSLCALKTRKLIVGGTEAEPKEFPHMAAVGFDDSEKGNGSIAWKCGGTLISAKVVLTAAHCLRNEEPKWVRVGDLNLAQDYDNESPQTIRIQECIKHPQYPYRSEYHDIAILRLENKVIYNAWVRPACLPVDPSDVGSDNKAVATGWGKTDFDNKVGSENLLKVTLNLVSHAYCNASFNSFNKFAFGIIDEWQICAGGEGNDTCQGDSGGPLVVFNTDHECMYNVIGITSHGGFCGSIAPGIYTRVSYYISWIERTAWPEYF